MKVDIPSRLYIGDRVALVYSSALYHLLNNAKKMFCCLNRFSLKADVDYNVQDHIGFLAGSDDGRASALNKALRNAEIRGFGCNRLLMILLDTSNIRDVFLFPSKDRFDEPGL